MNAQQLEVAARKLCEIRGIDPETMVPHGAAPDARGFVPAVLLHSPAWRMATQEVLCFYQVAQAIDFAFAGQEFP